MNFICFDTEDNSKELLERVAKGEKGVSGFDKVVTQIAAITAEGKRYYNRGDEKDFTRWLLQQPEKFIYCLNMQYDLGNLFGKEIDKLDCTLVGGRMIKAVWGNKVFVDVFNIWPMSVKKLGEAFGIEKLKTNSMADDKEYVFRDVEIIREAMLFAWTFISPLGIKALPPTLGGLCVKVWRSFGGDNCHDSTLLSREALFGGRVELFKARNDSETVLWTDINSLYPFVMQSMMFPGEINDTGKKLLEYGVAKVTVQVKETDLAVLPYRNRDGRILYPWGKFTGVWTIAELNAATANGATILKVHEAYGTNEGTQPYAEFVTNLYQARLDSTSDAEKLFYKLLMNNLYGRLGTAGEIGRTVWQTPENKNKGVPFGDKVLVKYKMPLPIETNWLHAAHVTAYGRLELFRYMKQIGTKHLIYVDTDSNIFDSLGVLPPFATGKALGQMKLVTRCSVCGGEYGHRPACAGSSEIKSWPDCATYAPKMYQAGGVHKAKGVPKGKAKEFIEKGHVHFDIPFKFREAVAFFDRKNSKHLSVWRTVEKFKRSGYDRKKLIGNQFFPCKVME